MKRLLSKLIFKINGWKIIGVSTCPEKCIIVTAPHTSNWDFFIGRCYAYIIALEPKYLTKSELFLPFLGTLIKRNGGIPVFRKAKHNVVDQVVEMINSSIAIVIGIAPEGTRKKVEKWKTGFYHIAVKANVPILLLKMDYEKKETGIMCEFNASGNFEKDMFFIQEQYKNIKGKKPEYYNTKIY